MKLTKTPDGYVVHVPDDVVESLGLKEGDGITLSACAAIVEHHVDPEKSARPATVFERLARPLPPGYAFDREEANSR